MFTATKKNLKSNLIELAKKVFTLNLLTTLILLSGILISNPKIDGLAAPLTMPIACLTNGVFDSAVADNNPDCTGKIQYRVIYKTVDCVAKTFDFEVQVKSDPAFPQPTMGDFNIRLEYNATVMTRIGTGSGSLVEQNAYSSSTPANDTNYGSQNLNGSQQAGANGILSLNGFYGGGGIAGELIPTTFKTISTIRMNIVNPTAPLNIDIHDITSFPVTGNNVVLGDGSGNFDLANGYQASTVPENKNIDLVGQTQDALCNLPAPAPKIELLKKATVADTNQSGTINEGDTITYNFAINNTGNVELTNIVVTDPKCIVTPTTSLETLAIGASDSTYLCTYSITADDMLAGQVENSATVTSSKTPNIGVVTDISDDENNPDNPGLDDPTITPLPLIINPPFITPSVELLKKAALSDTNNSGSVGVDDTITYSFTVKNTGNVELKNVTITDPKCTITPSTPLPVLAVGVSDSTTFKCTYIITPNDALVGTVTNSATVTAKDSAGNSATDISDDENNSDNPGDADPTVVVVTKEILSVPNPRIELFQKSTVADTDNSGNVNVGDVITYNFIIKNSGNFDLTNVLITNPKCNITPITPLTTLAIGAIDSTTYSCLYTITMDDVIAGKVENSSLVTTNGILNIFIVQDVSDDLNDLTKTGVNDPTVDIIPMIILPPSPVLTAPAPLPPTPAPKTQTPLETIPTLESVKKPAIENKSETVKTNAILVRSGADNSNNNSSMIQALIVLAVIVSLYKLSTLADE